MYYASYLATLKSVLELLIMILQYIIMPVFLYHATISIFGWVKRKEKLNEAYFPKNRFALVVAAHNEEKVVGNIVRNLSGLDYPREMYDIFVIADNCSDNTACVAIENGAYAFERSDGLKKGKGFALEWMFEKIFAMEKKYDAVCVFDADNLASLNFLTEMDKQLSKGHKVIQGYLDSKNPKDSLIAGSYAITYWLNNRLYQLARYYLGLSCTIGGTGFTVATDILKEIGWGATCLTEDLEFSIKLILQGKKVYWAHDAVVYDEKPVTLAQSWRQRKRWMQGQADCAVRYFTSLMKKFITERNFVAFDCALYVIQPLLIVAGGVVMLANLARFLLLSGDIDIFSTHNLQSGLLLFITTYITVIFLLIDGHVSKKILFYFLLFPFYNLTWIPIIIQGYIDKDKKEWSHTLHTRAIDISELERLKRAG